MQTLWLNPTLLPLATSYISRAIEMTCQSASKMKMSLAPHISAAVSPPVPSAARLPCNSLVSSLLPSLKGRAKFLLYSTGQIKQHLCFSNKMYCTHILYTRCYWCIIVLLLGLCFTEYSQFVLGGWCFQGEAVMLCILCASGQWWKGFY